MMMKLHTQKEYYTCISTQMLLKHMDSLECQADDTVHNRVVIFDKTRFVNEVLENDVYETYLRELQGQGTLTRAIVKTALLKRESQVLSDLFPEQYKECYIEMILREYSAGLDDAQLATRLKGRIKA